MTLIVAGSDTTSAAIGWALSILGEHTGFQEQPRGEVAEDRLDGHDIVPDDRVLVSVIGFHQNPAAWDAPREFRLNRHEGADRSRPDRRWVYLPFSAGPRICGGARFAQMEMGLALMLVLQRCRLDLPAPLPLAFEWGASMRRRGGQVIRAVPL